jgi:hypothetical protein
MQQDFCSLLRELIEGAVRQACDSAGLTFCDAVQREGGWPNATATCRGAKLGYELSAYSPNGYELDLSVGLMDPDANRSWYKLIDLQASMSVHRLYGLCGINGPVDLPTAVPSDWPEMQANVALAVEHITFLASVEDAVAVVLNEQYERVRQKLAAGKMGGWLQPRKWNWPET